MIGHQAVGPDLATGAPAAFGQPIEIEGVVVLGKKCRLTSVAALGYMMRRSGNNEAGKTGHGDNLWHPGIK